MNEIKLSRLVIPEALAMKTQIDVNEVNVSRPEAMRRYLISATLIGAVLLSPATVPNWIALAACYPAFTALVQWDPVNAMCQSIINHLSETTRNALFRSSTAVKS